MKTRIEITLATILMSFSISLAQGTETDMAAFFNGATSDANKLLGAYLSPVVKGVSYGMTSSWYNTAKTHKLGGVDLGVSLAVVNLPTSEETFNPQAILAGSTTTTTSNTVAPTIIGDKTVTTYNFNAHGYTIANVNGPEGLQLKKNIGMNAVPVPIIQAGIGLIKNTDLKIRFLPQQNISGSTVKMLGFGLMHDIKQYFPGVKLLPFDLSIIAAFNSVTGASNLSDTKTDPVTGWPNQNDGIPYSPDGKGNYKFNSWLFQALISKKVSVLTFYAGLGYAAVSSTTSITGHFTLDNPLFQNPATNPAPAQIVNPYSANYSNNGLKFTAGMRLKLGPIYFNGDYSLQKYNALTVGFGASIR